MALSERLARESCMGRLTFTGSLEGNEEQALRCQKEANCRRTEEHLPVLGEETMAGVLEKAHLVDGHGGSEGDTGDGGPSHSGFIGHVGMGAFTNK